MEVMQEQYKDTKIGRIPKEWEVVKLGEVIVNMKSGLSRMLSVQDIGTPVIRSNNIKDYQIDFNDLKYWFEIDPQGSKMENYYLNDGDILINFINSIAHIGKSAIYFNNIGRKVIYTTNVLRLTSNESINNVFLFYLTQSGVYRNYISKITKPAVNQASFTTKDLRKLRLPLPPLPEQQKIAEILSTVDEQISTTQAIIDKSKELKKGLMQKLFSEGIGHAEFKDTKIGRIPKEWEVLKLGDICVKIRDGNYGGSYPKPNEFLDSGIPFLTSASIGGGNFIIKEKIKYISSEKHSELIKAHIQTDDILFTNRGANVGAVALISKELDDANIGPQLTYLRCKKDQIHNVYLFSYMQSNGFLKQVKSLDNGTAMNFFGIGTTKTFKIPIPPLSKQQKIAEILSESDRKIEEEEAQKAELEQLKRGLMQQLLTGQKRVKI
jgi:type I restriction enzyme, S subunit